MKRLFMRALLGLCCAVIFASTASAGIFAYYSFDTDYTDGSGNGRDGTFVDAGTLGNSGITNVSGEYQFGGGGLNLSLDRDYVNLTQQTFGTNDNYSVAFWAKRAPGDTGGHLNWDMVIGDNNTSSYFIALHDGGNSTVDNANEGVLGALRFRSGPNVNQDYLSIDQADVDWHHHTIVMDGVADTASYYLDGNLVGTLIGRTASTFIYNAIGSGYNTSNTFDFHGQLDEVYIFDEAISAATVTSLFQTNSIPEPSTFVLGALGLGWLGLHARKRRRIRR